MYYQNNLNEEYAGMNRVGFDYVGGKYYSSDSRTSDIYNDHMVSYNERLDDKVDVNVAVGTSFTRHYSRNTSITTNIDTCGIPNAFVPQIVSIVVPIIQMVVRHPLMIVGIIPIGVQLFCNSFYWTV